ncbi:MAG: DUF4173 domain-containing protein [Flavobacteriales bacterium]|nr:DUF4173 domain-containing protein [Flavobacteriales bacterium]
MSKRLLVINAYILALIFTLLFYKQSLGFNLLIFEVILMIYWVWKLDGKIFSKPLRYIWFGTLLSALAIAYHGSYIARVTNITSLFLLNGFLVTPYIKSIAQSFMPAAENLIYGPFKFIRSHSSLFVGGKVLSGISRYVKIGVIPFVIIFVFLGLYSGANSIFGEHVSGFFGRFEDIGELFNSLFSSGKFWVFILGLTFSGVFLFHHELIFGEPTKLDQSDDLKRIKRPNRYPRYFKMNALKNELRSGVFLFAVLNVMLLVLNILDIRHVWFGFEWDQQYLKEFVHEGTYFLIFSILIAMVVVLFYFRKNLNFIKNIQLLKTLAIVWTAQNIFLALSVAMRNFWYIKYYNLAYLRIGVFFFLIVSIIGLVMIIRKIKEKRSSFFLVRKTSLAIYVALLGLSIMNWDGIIAKFNFSRYSEAFMHFDFMAKLSDKTLPLLDRTETELATIQEYQYEYWEHIIGRHQYMHVNVYKDIIDDRIQQFSMDYEQTHWLSKNWLTIQAHEDLVSKYGDFGEGNDLN